MLSIDASQGKGGTDIFCTALAMTLVTGQAARIENIRAAREPAGLLRHHLRLLQAAVELCDAQLEGAEVGAQTLTITPGSIKPGELSVHMSTAQGVTWALAAFLPALLSADAPTVVRLKGGTHSPGSPLLEEYTEGLFPLLERMGASLEVQQVTPGFYPAGGGELVVTVTPPPEGHWTPLHLIETTELSRKEAVAIIAHLGENIAQRELDTLNEKMTWADDELTLTNLRTSPGPGNALLVKLHRESHVEIFGGVGERGVKAETVAENVAAAAREYLAAQAPVSRDLARRLLPFIALANEGAVSTLAPDPSLDADVALIQRFMGVEVAVANIRGHWQLEI